MSNTLALFWNLAATDREARIDASNELLSELLSQSSDVSAVDVSEQMESPISEQVTDEEVAGAEQRLDDANQQNVSYALRRLVRGLASPRENARVGFAVALSGLLSYLKTVSAKDVLVLLLKYSVARGNMNGQEVRDLHFARLFGVYALVRSRLLYRASLSTFQRAFHVLIQVASYKSWLSEPCGWVLIELVQPLARNDPSRPSWAGDALAWIADQLSTHRSLSPETLALALEIALMDPSLKLSERMIPPFKSPNFLASANLPILASVLREAAPMHWQPDIPVPKAGSWSTKLPFVWDRLLSLYLNDKMPEGAAPFADFFRVVVDESLFAPQASPERKSWGFQVLHRTLAQACADVLPFLFTPHVMRTWVNQLSVPDRLLHSMAQKTVLLVGDAVKRSPTAGIALVTQLTGEHGRQNFDRVTHTKTIESILSSLDEEGVQRYLAYLRDIIYAPTSAASEDAKSITMQRQSACDQMLGLVRSHLVQSSGGWVRDVLVFFAGHGYYAVKNPPKAPWNGILQVPTVPFTDALREVCRSRLQACLVELKEPDEGGTPWPLAVMDMLDTMEKDHKHFTTTARPIARERIQRAEDLLHRLRNTSKKEKNETRKMQLRAFQVLVVSVILVTFEDADDAPDMVDSVVDAAKLLFFHDKSIQHEMDGIELLTDALVGLLELSSAFLRSMAIQVFATFSGSMTRNSLIHLVDQLGMGETEDAEGEELEAEEGEEEHEEGDEEEDEENETEDEEEDEEDDDNSDVDPVLRSRVEEAFRSTGMMDDDDEDEDDTVMDDDQMAQLDDKLAEIFQQHTSSKRKEREWIERDTALFHNKILDLLDIYAKEQSGNILVLRLVTPLLALARGSGDTSQQVANRASQILRQRLCKSKDLPHGDNWDVEEVVSELNDTHELLRTSQDAKLADLAAAVSHLYTKVLVRHGLVQETVNVFKLTLDDFFERKSSPIRPAFLIEAIRRYPELGWGLRHALLHGCRASKAARAFRQVQAFSMLQVLLQQQQHEDMRQASLEEILLFIEQVRAVVVDTVQAAAAQDDDSAAILNAQRLKDVLRFTLQSVRVTLRMVDGQASRAHACWPPAEVSKMLECLQHSERFKSSTSLHSILKEVHTLLCKEDANMNKKRSVTESAPGKRAKARHT